MPNWPMRTSRASMHLVDAAAAGRRPPGWRRSRRACPRDPPCRRRGWRGPGRPAARGTRSSSRWSRCRRRPSPAGRSRPQPSRTSPPGGAALEEVDRRVEEVDVVRRPLKEVPATPPAAAHVASSGVAGSSASAAAMLPMPKSLMQTLEPPGHALARGGRRVAEEHRRVEALAPDRVARREHRGVLQRRVVGAERVVAAGRP